MNSKCTDVCIDPRELAQVGTRSGLYLILSMLTGLNRSIVVSYIIVKSVLTLSHRIAWTVFTSICVGTPAFLCAGLFAYRIRDYTCQYLFLLCPLFSLFAHFRVFTQTSRLTTSYLVLPIIKLLMTLRRELQIPYPRKVLDGKIIYVSQEFRIPRNLSAPVLCNLCSAMPDNFEHYQDIWPNVY